MIARPESRTRPCNVLVIGSGAAGLRAAIAARDAGVAEAQAERDDAAPIAVI